METKDNLDGVEKDRQNTYERNTEVLSLLLLKVKVLNTMVCACNLSYPAYAILYCQLWTVWLYHAFSTLSHNCILFGKKNS
jgi:hypothetical protein